MDEVGVAFAKIHDDPKFQERVVGSAIMRLQKIASDAHADKKYHASIAATRALVSLVGIRGERWRPKKTEEEQRTAEPEAAGVDALSEDELDSQLRSIERRFEVYQGGAASGG